MTNINIEIIRNGWTVKTRNASSYLGRNGIIFIFFSHFCIPIARKNNIILFNEWDSFSKKGASVRKS